MLEDEGRNEPVDMTQRTKVESRVPRPIPRAAVEDWPEPSAGGNGLGRAFEIVRARWSVVIGLMAVSIAVVLVVVPQLSKVYEARATLLIEPVPNSDPTFVGLGLPRDSSDPTRNVETVSQLVGTPAVAERVRVQLALQPSVRSLLEKISAVPVAQSNVVAVTARAGSADGAARLANAFVNGVIAERTARLHKELDQLIPRLRSQIKHLDPSARSALGSLETKLQNLQTLRGGPDPTLHVASLAQPPGSPSSPRLALSVAAALVGGLILGIGVLLVMELFDPRLRREQDLRRYLLPILARVPLERRHLPAGPAQPLLPRECSLAVLDAYHLLAAVVTSSVEDGRSYSMAVTGPTASVGKTTTALNIATAFAQLGRRVILVEADSRQPSIAAATRVHPPAGIREVAEGTRSLEESLVGADSLPDVRLLLQEGRGGATALTAKGAQALLESANGSADWVIVDAPAPNYQSSGLAIAVHVDLVLVVVRLGQTRMRDLAELADLLAQQQITPFGFVVVGEKGPDLYRRWRPRSPAATGSPAAVTRA
jgi:polysaccharide biosynthesis transport protein